MQWNMSCTRPVRERHEFGFSSLWWSSAELPAADQSGHGSLSLCISGRRAGEQPTARESADSSQGARPCDEAGSVEGLAVDGRYAGRSPRAAMALTTLTPLRLASLSWPSVVCLSRPYAASEHWCGAARQGEEEVLVGGGFSQQAQSNGDPILGYLSCGPQQLIKPDAGLSLVLSYQIDAVRR